MFVDYIRRHTLKQSFHVIPFLYHIVIIKKGSRAIFKNWISVGLTGFKYRRRIDCNNLSTQTSLRCKMTANFIRKEYVICYNHHLTKWIPLSKIRFLILNMIRFIKSIIKFLDQIKSFLYTKILHMLLRT